MKKYNAILGGAMFFVVCFSLYLMLESTNLSPGAGRRIDGQVPPGIFEMNQASYVSGPRMNVTYGRKQTVAVSQDMCSFAEKPPDKTEVQMLDQFDLMAFDNPDGGAWKQGWNIVYDPNSFANQKLKVFVVPHSHEDPGWIKTFEKYYQDQTQHIINNMIDKLEVHKEMKFIYAEMSFLNMWWDQADSNKKERMKKLVDSGRLEIVTGGWVMTDEANAHYFAMLDQMIEGNMWVNNQLGVIPKSGWAIDPFGHSPTMAYLLKRMDFSNMLVQRIHYSVKKHLAKRKQLEFLWRQNWDHEGDTDMFCHMMPFYSYDVPHTCGPDPKICCQFDFKRLPGGRITCPWKVPPQEITQQNVAQKAEALLDQYKKKAQLYQNNVVLAPLGDDFRYDVAVEWDQQYHNYKRIFDYVNNHPELNAELQFGTLSDYFNAVHERAGTEGNGLPKGYPVLSGDFYTYADRDDHYWSGYFTSRPFYKILNRVLEAHLRGAEIIFTAAIAHSKKQHITSFPTKELMKSLISARRSLGLYQHHDGITGTAKDHVVVDYGVKTLEALNGMKTLIAKSAHALMVDKDKYTPDGYSLFFDLDEERLRHDSLPDRTVITVSEEFRPVSFYNSLGHDRQSVVRIYLSEAHVEIIDHKGNTVPSQVEPYWVTSEDISYSKYKVSFVAIVPAAGITTYRVRKTPEGANKHHTVASIDFINGKSSSGSIPKSPFTITQKPSEDVLVESNEIKALFSAFTGTVQEVKMKTDDVLVSTKVQFVTYGTRKTAERSGAYLFLPDGQAKAMSYSKPFMRVIRGPIVSEVQSFIPHCEHSSRIYNSPGLDSLGIEISNIVDITSESNKELAMRIMSNVQNDKREFFTDLNGFQIQKRKTLDKLPLQGNYYPMPTMAFIQDSSKRLSVLSAQSLGCASLETGWLEIMQDRRLNQDDSRGLGQGVLDNKRTPTKFVILIEKREQQNVPTQPAGYPSLTSHLKSQELIHPLHHLPQKNPDASQPVAGWFQFLHHELPCDHHLVNFKVLESKADETEPQDVNALILHRLASDCSFPTRGVTCDANNGKIVMETMLNGFFIEESNAASLNLLHHHGKVDIQSPLELDQMEIYAFRVEVR